ncbi:MAG: diguanylate cyclase [Gallionellaceae bacterium]|jgi:diguanylate cyclase (GGDEF)-like protein/PAS domain S-box-containing protein
MTRSKSRPNSDVESPREYGLTACLLLVAAYIITGKLGLMLALPPGYASPVFPPAGIAIAAALIRGRKSLPWIFLGSLILNIWVGYSATQHIDTLSLVVALVIAIASVSQAALGGWGLRRMIGYPVSLDHGGEVLRFLLSAPVVCITSATISVASLSYLGIFKPDDLIENWLAWWVGDTLGLIVMFPLFMIIVGEPRRLWQGRKYTVAIPMLLTFTLFVMIFLKANQWEYRDSLMEFHHLSVQTASDVQQKLGEQAFALEQAASLFDHDLKDGVGREEFHRFVQNTLSRYPDIQALSWAPMVSSERRADFEHAQRKVLPKFEIREKNGAGQLVQAEQRKIFFPVTFVEPLASNINAIGYDLLSDTARKEALLKAFHTGKMVSTPVLHLVQDNEKKVSLLLIQAIDLRDQKRGVVTSILRINDFAETLLRNTNAMIYTRIVDLDAHQPLFDDFPLASPKAIYEQSFYFGMRQYRLETAPTSAYLAAHQGWQSWSVLAAGILGTGLLGALFLLGTGYAARVHAQVDERTKELNESKQRLQEAQNKTQISSANMRALLDNLPYMTWLKDTDGRYITVNKTFSSFFGMEDTQAVIGKTDADFSPRDLAEKYRADDAQVMTSRQQKQVEESSFDGRATHWLETFKTPIVDDSGNVLGTVGFARDITSRKQEEEALRISEKQMAFSQRIGGTGSWVYDVTTNSIHASENSLALFGFPPGVYEYPMDDFLVCMSNRAQVSQTLADAIQTGRDYFDEYEIRPLDGSPAKIIRSIGWAEKNEQGNPIKVMGFIQDITERKKVEQQLRDSESRMKEMFENLRSGVATYRVSPDGQKFIFTSFNMAAERIEKLSRNEVIGKNLQDVFPGVAEFGLLDVLKRVWLSGIAEHFPLSFYQDGHIAGWRENYVFKLQGGEVVAIYDDVTKEKQAEERIQYLAHYDALTGLPNRALTIDRLSQILAAAKREKSCFALMYIDLDKFKPVNDEFGHEAGDKLLKEAAIRMQSCVRESDSISRIGGDEFLVLLPAIEGEADAMLVAEKILNILIQPFEIAGHSLSISGSIGIAIYPQHGGDEKILTKNADSAMYQAKERGRNKAMLYQPEV